MIFKIQIFSLLLNVLLYAQISTFETILGGGDIDIPAKIVPTNDSGFVIAGYTNSYGNGDYDYYLVKIDKCGNYIWSNTFGGDSEEILYDFKLCKDNGFILSGATKSFGTTYNNIYLVKTDSRGDTLWTKQIRIAGSIGYSIALANIGFILGSTIGVDKDPQGSNDFWLLRLDDTGDTLWTRTYSFDGGVPLYEYITFVSQTEDSGIFMAGQVNFGEEAIGLIKTDAFGNVDWKTYYSQSSDDVHIRSGLYIPETGYFFTGYYQNNGGSHPYRNFHIWKFNVAGKWIKDLSCYNSYTPVLETKDYGGHDIYKTTNNDIIVIGQGVNDTASGLGLAKFSQNLDKDWQRIYKNYVSGYSITEAIDRGLVIAGISNDDIIVVKMDSIGQIASIKDRYNIPLLFELYQNYPNPFNPKTRIDYNLHISSSIEIKIFNLLGQEIQTLIDKYQHPGRYSVIFDGSDLSSGIYIYQINAGSYSKTCKMLLLR